MTDTSNENPLENTWKRMSFNGNKVWVATKPDGDFLLEKDKVLIKYNLKQDYEYRVKIESLKTEGEAIPAGAKKAGRKKTGKALKKSSASPLENNAATLPDKCIQIYTDGASSGNPGPSGIGALLLYGENRKEISQSIGVSTNNIAELTAILMALTQLKRFDLPVRVFTDSRYAIGLLAQGWKSRKNKELVEQIRTLVNRFADLEFIKVKGHAGIKENEVADFLATSAIKKK